MSLLRIASISEMQQWREKNSSRKIGFVPTMGALHEGHAELLRRARKECDLVVLSIFVNPTQFNDPKDFEKYPSTVESDCALAEKNDVDVVFLPNKSMLYPDDYRYKVTESQLSQQLCGAHRPGHFDGVLTIVLKLFNLVRPQFAYFGEKDFQQLSLIQGMVDALFLNLKIVPVPTVREASGLAMSSRNQRLSPKEQTQAAHIYKMLKTPGISSTDIKQLLEKDGFRVDYVEDIGQRRFVAAFLGEVRLIDNVEI